MSFFHLMLDYAINNAYALYRWVLDNYHSKDNNDHRKKPKCIDLYDFKMQIGIDLCSLSTNTKKFCTDNLTDVDTNFIRINRKRKLTEMNCIPRRVDLSVILTYKRQAHTMHILRRFKLEPKYKEHRSPRHKRYQCFLHGKFFKDRRQNTIYGCTFCKVPLCPECFSIYHGMNYFDSWLEYNHKNKQDFINNFNFS